MFMFCVNTTECIFTVLFDVHPKAAQNRGNIKYFSQLSLLRLMHYVPASFDQLIRKIDVSI